MRTDVGANLITRETNIAASQQVAFTLEKKFLRQPYNFKSLPAEPFNADWHFAAPHVVAKVTRNELFSPNDAGVGAKNHVRQTGYRLDKIDLQSQAALQDLSQVRPLPTRALPIALPAFAHPWVDLVFDAVVIRRTH